MPSYKLHWQSCSADALQSSQELQEDWDRLNSERANLPFMTATAICTAIKIFGSGIEKLLIARDANQAIAMLIATPSGFFQWSIFQPSQIPLGVWVCEKSITAEIISHSILRGPLGFCLGFSMTQLDPLLSPRKNDSITTKNIDYIDTGWIDIVGTFDDYWSERGKNLRQNMRKQRNKLAAEATNIYMRALTSPEEMAGAVERYGILESSGWKASKGTAIHPDNAQGKFYIELLENAAKNNGAIVYEYFFNQKTVALNLCIKRDGILVILKTTYDESINNFSPAFLLNQDIVELLFNEGNINRLEYYGRMMEWHTRWTDKKRTLYHLTSYRWSWLKKLAEKRQGHKNNTLQPPAPTESSDSIVQSPKITTEINL